MEEAIANLLLNNPAVTGIVGNRVNWSARPDDADLPAVTLHRITGRHDAALDGRTGLISSPVQIDAWGRTYREAKLLARAIVPALPHARTLTGGVVRGAGDTETGGDLLEVASQRAAGLVQVGDRIVGRDIGTYNDGHGFLDREVALAARQHMLAALGKEPELKVHVRGAIANGVTKEEIREKIREMKRNGVPMDKVISVNWFNEVDIANIGAEEAKGIKRGTNVVGGTSHPLIQQIINDLYAKGKGNGDRKNLDDIYYNTGLAMYSTAFEGVRLAIKQSGMPLNADKIKKGLESLRNFDANGLIAPVTVTAKDHGGGGKTRIDMWDGAKWVPQSDWISAYPDVVMQIVKEQSAEFAKATK